MTRTRAAALGVPLCAAGAGWAVTVQQMRGMDMGSATELGSFAFFTGTWVAMMAAMMLPAAVPAVSKFSRDALAAPVFAGSYLAVWTLFGVALYVLYEMCIWLSRLLRR